MFQCEFYHQPNVESEVDNYCDNDAWPGGWGLGSLLMSNTGKGLEPDLSFSQLYSPSALPGDR